MIAFKLHDSNKYKILNYNMKKKFNIKFRYYENNSNFIKICSKIKCNSKII